ncbi:MAG: hypothetical protein ACPGJS_23075 [Flammeovirgaceae bacterium]
MKSILFVLCFWFCATVTYAQWPASVNTVESKPNQTVEVRYDFAAGMEIQDLHWASRSSTACFPATQHAKFRGKHVLIGTAILPYSIMEITVIPDNQSENLSLYAYQIGTNDYTIPPHLKSCVSCEAEHQWDYKKRGKTQDHTRTVELNAIKNPYHVLIGVSGPAGVKGSFTLRIKMETKVAEKYDDTAPAKVYRLQPVKGKTLAYQGDLAEGKHFPLDWAATSNMACFPATRFEEFRGNHVFYVVDLPRYSKVKVTVTSVDGKRINIYGMSGYDGKSLPPNIRRCVSCEASYERYVGKPNLNKDAGPHSIEFMAINNPYKILIGVAGAKGVDAGKFQLQVELSDR